VALMTCVVYLPSLMGTSILPRRYRGVLAWFVFGRYVLPDTGAKAFTDSARHFMPICCTLIRNKRHRLTRNIHSWSSMSFSLLARLKARLVMASSTPELSSSTPLLSQPPQEQLHNNHAISTGQTDLALPLGNTDLNASRVNHISLPALNFCLKRYEQSW
jgi:hypothetical protein